MKIELNIKKDDPPNMTSSHYDRPTSEHGGRQGSSSERPLKVHALEAKGLIFAQKDQIVATVIAH